MLLYPEFHVTTPEKRVVAHAEDIQLGISSKTGTPMLGLHLKEAGWSDKYVGWVYVQPKDLQALCVGELPILHTTLGPDATPVQLEHVKP